jgi:hypothetical protein
MVDNSNQKLKTTLRKRGRDEGRFDPDFTTVERADGTFTLNRPGILNLTLKKLNLKLKWGLLRWGLPRRRLPKWRLLR